MEIQVRPVDRQVMADLMNEGMSRAMARVYAGRGIKSIADLEYLVQRLEHIPMKDQDKAVSLLLEALENQSHICISGDYDCDGATATAVMVRGLRSLGFKNVDFLVPNRFRDGYGLTPPIVEQVLQRGADLLITVDNGISSIAGVAAAKAAGLKVIVTDHHLAGEVLPEADAILDPNQPGCAFPWKSTAGVGVAFMLILALFWELESRELGEFPNPKKLTPLVALGTVADVVPLEYNNRLLVDVGLRRWRKGWAPEGLLALARVSRVNIENLQASSIGFQIGPRLNAAGRMDDMTIGIRCLLEDDPEKALELAKELDQFNRERRVVEKEQCSEALIALPEDPTGQFGLTAVIPDGHIGVIGIVAGRLKEEFHRPVIVFAQDGDWLKGSGRSIPGFHLRDALADLAKDHPDWFKAFGGHAMAAGMTLRAEVIADFSREFDQLAETRIPTEVLEKSLVVDGILSPAELSTALAEEIRSIGIWGQEFPEPMFMGSFEVASCKVMKGGHLRLELDLPNQRTVAAVWFNQAEAIPEGTWLQLVYSLDFDAFRWGALQLRVIWGSEAPQASQELVA
ncbi:single-stranded-DNA-specific exonuclease RecJ [Acidithiobacillus thiooxidans]|uniref:single-stranded-DNA-specific exonuclease RecJ n=1 Tax=Acidithiobacillus thiooxidans TaxID=930 RepID=UPI0004E1A6DF|nr:single-stranded-DNA-specific exonuclease RecJ [Acidithiobacillus thiooxidans]